VLRPQGIPSILPGPAKSVQVDPGSQLQDERRRAVVRERDLHVSAEEPGRVR
jgi:hypothetical protein